MSTPAPQPATTPIPVQLSAPECPAFLLPPLSMPKRGPTGKLGDHRVFHLIVGGLYPGLQWQGVPVPRDAQKTAPIPYTTVQGMFGPAFPPGRRNYWKASFLDELSDEAIDILVAWFKEVPSPFSAAACGLYGGAVGRIAADATAFSQRDAAFGRG